MADRQNFSLFGDTLARSLELGREARKTGLNFLKAEIATGLSFAKVAMDSEGGSEKRIRSQANARKAYDTIMDWCSRHGNSVNVGIPKEELEPELTELQKILRNLGEAV